MSMYLVRWKVKQAAAVLMPPGEAARYMALFDSRKAGETIPCPNCVRSGSRGDLKEINPSDEPELERELVCAECHERIPLD